MPTGAERIQQIEHAKRLLIILLAQLHAEQQRIMEEKGRLELRVLALDNELAAIHGSHLADI